MDEITLDLNRRNMILLKHQRTEEPKMVTAIENGTQIEEFALNVVEYLQRQEQIKEAQAKADAVKDSIKTYMEANNLTEATVGEHIIKLLEVTRETVNTKIAKTLIPKKYLDKDGVLTTTTYQQLRFDRRKA